MSVTCFLVEETSRAIRYLRRFTFPEHPCSATKWGCNAVVWIGEHESVRTEEGFYRVIPVEIYQGDPRWPTVCEACSQPFSDNAEWMVNQEPLYLKKETGERWKKRDLPPGAMYNAWWMPPEWSGKDGLSLVVVLPDSIHWTMDCPSPNGKPWQRTGIAPTITATPSILTPRYHGWLRDGVLVPC